MMSDEHQQELKDSPWLQRLRQTPGPPEVGPPEGYFAQMQRELQDRLDDEAVLSKAPRLRQAERSFSFTVPEGYFEQLPARIEQRRRVPAQRTIPLWERVSYGAVAAAAALALVWLLRSAAPAGSAPVAAGLAWRDIPTEQLMALALEDDFDPSLMVEVLGEDGLTSDRVMSLPDSEAWGEDALDEVLEEVELGDLEDAWLDLEVAEG